MLVEQKRVYTDGQLLINDGFKELETTMVKAASLRKVVNAGQWLTVVESKSVV